jgi:hypothetical protein
MSQDSREALSGLMEQAHITASSDGSHDITRPDQTVYRPLNSGLKEIRLLVVAPCTEDDIVSGTLKHVSLLDDPKPEFETISYCWGPAQDDVSIMLDGRMVTVPPSSEAAVRRMRLSDRSRVVWIDAICINQSSKMERSEQVSFMGIIYGSGKQNLIYLGEDDNCVAVRAKKCFDNILDEMHTATDGFATLITTLQDAKTGATNFSSEDFQSEIDFEALIIHYDLPWFR